MWLNPANPLDSYTIHESIATIEQRLGKSVDKILDVWPAATALMNFKTHVDDTEVAHIESCLLTPFRAEHRRKMWYVLNDIAVPETDEEEHEEDYDW
jgi:hypothetical protein